MEELIQRQADFVSGYRLENQQVLRRAKWILLDSIGCIINGLRGEKIAGERDGQIIDLTMAMVNTELYEGNKFAVGHPAAHLLPLLLVEGNKNRITAERFFEALIASYEIAGRWGASFSLPMQALGHGMTMTPGAALACVKLEDGSPELMRDSIMVAASLPNVSGWNAVYDGSRLHDAYAGFAAVHGRRAAALAKKGVGSSGRIIQEIYCDSLGAQYHPEKMTAGLGEDFYLLKNYFKVHTGCRFIHPFADILQGKLEDGLCAAEIQKIEIFTYKKAAKIHCQSVPNDLAGKFSTPVSLAVLLVKGVLDADSIRDCQEDKEIMELAGRIFLYEDEQYNRLLPDVRGGKVVIHKKDGTKDEEEVFHARGDYDHPRAFTEEELVNKFKRITAPYMEEEEQNSLADRILNSENPLQKITVSQLLKEFYEKVYEDRKGDNL